MFCKGNFYMHGLRFEQIVISLLAEQKKFAFRFRSEITFRIPPRTANYGSSFLVYLTRNNPSFILETATTPLSKKG